jgi:hypothetical protein
MTSFELEICSVHGKRIFRVFKEHGVSKVPNPYGIFEGVWTEVGW